MLWVLRVAVSAVVFFSPTFLARWRRHPRALAIGALNLVAPLGYLLSIGVVVSLWLAALCWALYPLKRPAGAGSSGS